MPFSNITSLAETDTFQTLFNSNNTVIDRLNLLKIGNINVGAGLDISSIGSTGGITLSVDSSAIASIGFVVNNIPPTGLTIGSAIGISGGTFSNVSNISLTRTRNYLGFISEINPSNYTITTSGTIITGVTLSDYTLYYLTDGGITSTIPTTNGLVVKPVLYSLGLTLGSIVLNQRETLISESAAYIKSSSRNIAEVPLAPGFSAGNVIFYDITGATWAKSKANSNNTSEVFGIVETIVGNTGTVVTQGSVTVPFDILQDMGLAGGSGGNDIWFLSAATAGVMQNLAPSTGGEIVKPVYYAYPHEYSGVTFSGLFVNYIGYQVGSTTTSDVMVLSTIPMSSGIVPLSPNIVEYEPTVEYMTLEKQLVYTDEALTTQLTDYRNQELDDVINSIPIIRLKNNTIYNNLVNKIPIIGDFRMISGFVTNINTTQLTNGGPIEIGDSIFFGSSSGPIIGKIINIDTPLSPLCYFHVSLSTTDFTGDLLTSVLSTASASLAIGSQNRTLSLFDANITITGLRGIIFKKTISPTTLQSATNFKLFLNIKLI